MLVLLWQSIYHNTIHASETIIQTWTFKLRTNRCSSSRYKSVFPFMYPMLVLIRSEGGATVAKSNGWVEPV